MAWKLAAQVCVICILVLIGILLKKKGVVSLSSAKQMSDFVLLVVSPALLVQSFQLQMDGNLVKSMLLMFGLSIAFHLLAILVTKPLFRPRADKRDNIEHMSAITSNCGFMGIPLMTAALGETGRIYAVIYLAVFNIYIWTHGVMLMKRVRKLGFKEALTGPGTLAALLGILLFVLQVRLPGVVADTLGFLSSMNTPLPMILIGVYIADISLRETLRDWRLYYTSFLRLIALPLVFLAVVWAVRAAHWFPGADLVVLAAMISCSCPVGVSCMLMPARFGGDAEYGAKLIGVSTLLSVITIPAVASLTEWVLSL